MSEGRKAGWWFNRKAPRQHGPLWRGVGHSIRGAQHVRRNQPCQDALAWSPGERQGQVLVMAIADGHGGERYSRSDVGARLAVDTATRLLDAFLRERTGHADPAELAHEAEHLPSAVETAWKRAVDEHRAGAASIAPDNDGPSGWGDDAEPYIPYGTTLLLVGVTPALLLALQLGDGDIVAIGADGAAWRPLPEDPLLEGNSTTSLCLPDAAQFMRLACLPLSPGTPALIMAATDGYANSFAEDAGFLQAALEYGDMIADKGHEWVAGQLDTWLQETSAQGSGDDITIGLLFDATLGPAVGSETRNMAGD